jgi:DNA-binding protein H-NS
MARRSSKMPENPDLENPDKDDIDEGRLPPSDISTLARGDDIGLDDMSTEELLTLIEDALDRLPVEELVTIRDAAEAKRLEHLDEEKNKIVEEMRRKLEKLGLSLEEALPQSASRGGRKPRSDTGRPLPVRYRSPNGDTWSGRGYPPKWVTQLESEGHNREEFKVTEG